MRVIAPMPTSEMFSALQNSTSSERVIALALPSIRITSCPEGVKDWSRNIHKCGIKLRVTPLSGLYNSIFICFHLSSAKFRSKPARLYFFNYGEEKARGNFHLSAYIFSLFYRN